MIFAQDGFLKIVIMDLLGDFDVEGAVGGCAEEVSAKVEMTSETRAQMRLLEREVEELQKSIQNIHIERATARVQADNETLVKPFMKPRDIPLLELRQLSGIEGAGRLTVFLSQVESCSVDDEVRQHIVQMRVDAPLALFIQNLRNRDHMSWEVFKQYLVTELTDQRVERLYDSINDFSYTCEEEPVEFTTRLKCKLAMLATKVKTEEVPEIDKLIKEKLFEGMPKASRERLKLYMNDSVSLPRFMNKLETERVIVAAQHETAERVRVIDPPVRPPPAAVAYHPPRPRRGEDRTLRQRNEGGKYCPYCRARNHTVAECRRRPRQGSCFDCLRMNCYRGHPECPGRDTRGRMA